MTALTKSEITDLQVLAAEIRKGVFRSVGGREFGWFVQSIDGHDVAAIHDAIVTAKSDATAPSMIVLDTVKGKGCQAAEEAVICHTLVMDANDVEHETNRQDHLIAALRSTT